MKKVIKHSKKMKNAMYIVFGAFALALFAITRIHPSYANEGLMIDDALDAIVLYGEVNQLPEDEEVKEVQEIEQIQEVEEDEDIVESEETTNEEIKEENKTSEDLDETILERDNMKIDKIENKVDIMTDKKATLLTGSEFNKKIKNLVPGANATNRYTTDNTIKNIRMATNVVNIPGNAVLISGADSDFPIYAWYNDGDIFYYFTGTDKIYLNQNSMGMFSYFKALENIDLSKFDTSDAKDISYMFYYDTNLKSLDLSNFNTSNVTTIRSLIRGSSTIKSIDLSNFDTSNVTDMADLFEECTALETVILDNWDLGGGSTLNNLGYGIFYNNPNLKLVSTKNWKNFPSDFANIRYFFANYESGIRGKLDVTNWDTSNVTSMYYAFNSMYIDEFIGLETRNTSNVTDMNGTFKSMKNIKSLNLSGWDTSKVEDMRDMFEFSENIEEIIGLDTWDTSSVRQMGCMFHECKKLKYINLDNRDLSSLNKMSDGGSSMFSQANSLTGISARNWKAPEDLYSWISSWTIYSTPVESIDVSNWDMSNVKKTNFMFTDITTPVKIIGLETWDTSGVINMRGMFTRSTGITGLDLSNWDTSNVEDMYMMFQGASNLETVYVGKNFNTDKVTNSENMFSGAVSLVGGKGTTFDENHIDKEYAKIDALGDSGYFTQGEFDIKYNLDGGELENKKISYKIRESFTIQEPVREEAVFLGWTGSNGNVLQKQINIQEGTTGDLEFTANWNINQYKIIFDTDGGNEISPIEKDYNSVINITLPTPRKECNAFSGWDAELPERMPAHDITLKAIWEYTCSRSSGGGGGAKKSESTTREIAIDTPTEQEHNSANEEQKSETNETSNTPTNGEISNQIISVTQEISEDGTLIEVVVQTVTIKNTDIVATVRTEIPSSNTTRSSSSSKTHTKEENDAYSFAKSNGITTTDSIDNAKMNTELTRIQMAKMLSNYAINVLGQEPDVSKGTIKFDDVTNKMDKQYDNAVTKAYQLGIMGQNMKNNEFRPNDEVTRAEFASALSRLLYQTEEGNYKGTGKYYIPHVARLYNEGIINKTDPKIKEKRGYVMTMLMRTVQ